MANGKIPNINNKFFGDRLVEVTFPDSTGSLGFDEYNAVLNNANSSITSSKIMDADYALNARIPTNNDRLLSGTAQRMEIQDSNYSSVAWTSPRYVGSKTISATYNDYQASGSSVTFADGTTGTWKGDQVFDEYPGDATFRRGNPLGKVPAVDLYSTHFVLFDRIEIDSALFDRDVFHCLYIIDDQGNKVPLTYKNKNLVDLQRLYAIGSNAEVVFLGQNNQELLDEYPIERVGIISKDDIVISNDLYISDDNDDLYTLSNTDGSTGIAILEGGTAVSQFTFSYNRYGTLTTEPDSSIIHRSVRLSPSLFSASLVSSNPNTYKLTYSNSNLRDYFMSLNNGNSRFALANSHRIQTSGSSHILTRENYRTSSYAGYYGSPASYLWDYNQSPPTNIAASASYLNPPPYNFNENSLDPFYILTYNSLNQKVFEGTIYETKINNAKFDSVNPYNVGNSGPLGIWNKILPNEQLINFNPMTPQSSLTSNTQPLKIGDFLEFGTFPITQNINSQFVNQADPYESIQEYLPIIKQIQTKVTDINLPGNMDVYNFKYDGFFGTGPNQGTWGCVGSVAKLPIAGNQQPLTMIDLYDIPPFPGLLNPTGNLITLDQFSGSFVALINEPVESQPPIIDNTPLGELSYTGYAPSENTWIWCSGSNYSPLFNRQGFTPGDMYGVVFSKHTSQYINYTLFGNPLDKLTHGDVIEFCLLSDYGPSNSYNNNQPLPESKVWRYMVLTAGDEKPFGLSNSLYDAVRYYITYINGHNNDPIPASNGFFTPTAGGPGVPAYPNLDYPSDTLIVYQIRKQTEDPSITVEVIGGNNDLSALLELSGSIMTKSDVTVHEQYIESQFLEGTGVGVLIPDNYDPKLREQLPDIINKTGIDVNSLT